MQDKAFRSLREPNMQDSYLFELVLRVARKAQGTTEGNPAVGVLITDEYGNVLAVRATGLSGVPHAEILALKDAEEIYKNGGVGRPYRLYATLEPCCHYGKTPPCTQAIIQAGIKEVFIAIKDPDKRVNGQGVEILESAGIKVYVEEYAWWSQAAAKQLYGYLKNRRDNLPSVTVKMAVSLDGKTALNNAKSKWITASQMRKNVQMLRYQNQGIMVGVGTINADHPELTCRIYGIEGHNSQRKRFIFDADLEINLLNKIIQTATDNQKFAPLYILTKAINKIQHAEKIEELQAKAIKIIFLDDKDILTEGLQAIAKEGVNDLLIEGGNILFSSLYKAKLIDRIILYYGNCFLGGDARNLLADMGFINMEDIERLKINSIRQINNEGFVVDIGFIS